MAVTDWERELARWHGVAPASGRPNRHTQWGVQRRWSAAPATRRPRCVHRAPAPGVQALVSGVLHWLRIDEAGGGALQLEVYGDHYDDKPGSVAALLLVEIIRLHQRIDELLQERIDDDQEFAALREAVEGR